MYIQFNKLFLSFDEGSEKKMAKTITVEQRTTEVIEALAEWTKEPRVRKLDCYGLMAYAAGYSQGKGVNMQRIFEYIEKLYVDGAIDG